MGVIQSHQQCLASEQYVAKGCRGKSISQPNQRAVVAFPQHFEYPDNVLPLDLLQLNMINTSINGQVPHQYLHGPTQSCIPKKVEVLLHCCIQQLSLLGQAPLHVLLALLFGSA